MTLLEFSNWDKISVLATSIAAFATSIYTILTYKLLSSTKENIKTSNKLAEFQIYTEINKQLSSPEASNLIDIIVDNHFCIDDLMSSPTEYATWNPPKKLVISSDINRLILGPLEDLGKFYQDGLITFDSINTGFGNLILVLWSNGVIQSYISFLREKKYSDSKLYCGTEELYTKVFATLSSPEQEKYKQV